MKIMLNPRLWTVTEVRVDDDTVARHDAEILVSKKQWDDDLSKRKTRQFGSRHRTFVEEGEFPEPERMTVRLEDLDELSAKDLRRACETHGLSTAGTKVEMKARLREALADG